MKILFDLAGTVLGSLDMSPRPGIKATIETLRARGNTVDFWTAGPVDDYAAILKQLGITGAVYSKYGTLPFQPDVCVDDSPYPGLRYSVLRVSNYAGNGMSCEDISVEKILPLAGCAIRQ